MAVNLGFLFMKNRCYRCIAQQKQRSYTQPYRLEVLSFSDILLNIYPQILLANFKSWRLRPEHCLPYHLVKVGDPYWRSTTWELTHQSTIWDGCMSMCSCTGPHTIFHLLIGLFKVLGFPWLPICARSISPKASLRREWTRVIQRWRILLEDDQANPPSSLIIFSSMISAGVMRIWSRRI